MQQGSSERKCLLLLVIRQKGESQNGCFKTTKHAKFSEKRTFLNPWYAHVRVSIRGVRNVRFSENLACFDFLKHPFWDLPLCLITDVICKLQLIFSSTTGDLQMIHMFWLGTYILLIFSLWCKFLTVCYNHVT